MGKSSYSDIDSDQQGVFRKESDTFKAENCPNGKADKTQPIMNGGKKTSGVKSEAMMKVGRNVARANYQGK